MENGNDHHDSSQLLDEAIRAARRREALLREAVSPPSHVDARIIFGTAGSGKTRVLRVLMENFST